MKKYSMVKNASIVGMLANLFLFVVKMIVGVYSKSQAMIADAFNSITDVFSSLMTFIGSRIASEQRDNDHNFGHEKAEYLFSMFISISIFLVAFKLLYDSFRSLFLNDHIIYTNKLIIVSLITIVIKMLLYLYTKLLYQKEKSVLLKSNNIDHRNDMFLTLFVLISSILSKYNVYFLDGLVGIIISIWFMFSGIKIFKESYNVLMDIAIPEGVKKEIIDVILSDSKVIKIDEINSMAIGYSYVIVLTICVDGNLNTFQSHKIASSIECKIKRNFEKVKDVFIHIHPV